MWPSNLVRSAEYLRSRTRLWLYGSSAGKPSQRNLAKLSKAHYFLIPGGNELGVLKSCEIGPMLSRPNLVKHRRCSWRPGMTKSEDKHFNLWLYVRTLILRCFAYVIKMLLTILSDKPHITCALPHVRLILSDKPLANTVVTLRITWNLIYGLPCIAWVWLVMMQWWNLMYGLPCAAWVWLVMMRWCMDFPVTCADAIFFETWYMDFPVTCVMMWDLYDIKVPCCRPAKAGLSLKRSLGLCVCCVTWVVCLCVTWWCARQWLDLQCHGKSI
jgi:hypothetical protein